MKKVKFFCALLIPIILSLCLLGCSVDLTDDETSNEATAGEKLDNAYAMITFMNHTLYGTGHRFAYVLTYDYSYYQKRKPSLTALMNELKTSFESKGYSVSIDTINGKFTASMDFDTTEEYYGATGYDGFTPEEGEAPYEIKKTAFYKEYTYRLETVFVDVNKDYKFVGRLLSVGCTKAGIPDDMVILCYEYGTPYKNKTIRSDADEIAYSADSRLYLHRFKMTTKTCDREITITNRIPNTTIWYVIALVAGVVAFAIPFGIFLLKKKRSK